MPQGKYYRISYGIILFLLMVYLTTKVSFLLQPFVTMIKVLLLPVMLSGFFFYLLRPLVNYLAGKKLKRSYAILLIYFVVGGIWTVFSIVFGPMLQTQVQAFIKNIPQMIEGFNAQLEIVQSNRFVSAYIAKNGLDVTAKVSDYLNKGINAATDYVSRLFSVVTGIVIIVTTVPIIVYYMLTDSKKFAGAILKWFPGSYKQVAKEMLEEIDEALSAYIISRITICFLLGVMVYVGFMLIHLPYSLLLSVVLMILNLIPFIGPIIGAVPSLIVAFTQSPSMVMWVLIVILAAQQIDGNFLSPHIYGKRMDVHPLTIILLLLAAGEVAGIMGIILVIPVYMVVKIIILHVNRLFIFRYD